MNNEDFELHPHYPPPHKDGAYPRYWPYWPQWPAGWHGWNDTEPASVGPWGCCPPPHPDDCVCVTQQDIDNWNNISAVSALSGIDLSSLSSISGMNLPYSATLWNSCYNTVNENSAMWNEISGLPELSGYVSAFSAWTVDKIDELSARPTKVYVDYDYYPYSLEGNGSKESPIGLSSDVRSLLWYLDKGTPMNTQQAIRYGGKASVPTDDNQWIASKTELKNVQNSIEDLQHKYTRQQTNLIEIWQAIELILNIITDKYKDIPEVQNDIRNLTDVINNQKFIQNNGNP